MARGVHCSRPLFNFHLNDRTRNRQHTCVATEVPASVIAFKPGHSEHMSSRHGCALQKRMSQ